MSSIPRQTVRANARMKKCDHRWAMHNCAWVYWMECPQCGMIGPSHVRCGETEGVMRRKLMTKTKKFVSRKCGRELVVPVDFVVRCSLTMGKVSDWDLIKKKTAMTKSIENAINERLSHLDDETVDVVISVYRRE